MEFGVSADDIIYANTSKSSSMIRHSQQAGVDLMTFDNEEELYKMARVFPDARLVVRIKADDSKSVFKFSDKFGATVREAMALIDLAKKLNLNVVGVSFHVGSSCESLLPFYQAIQDAKLLFAYGQNLNFNMQILDLGGGFPGSSFNTKLTFEQIADTISRALDEMFPPNMVEGLRIIAEPGRYYGESSMTLITRVIAKKELIYSDEKIAHNRQQINQNNLLRCPAYHVAAPAIHQDSNFDDESSDDSNGKKKESDNIDYTRGMMYYLNDGVYGSFNSTILNHWPVHPEGYHSARDVTTSPPATSAASPYIQTVIWGPTCTSMDVICKSILMPELNVDDVVVFRNLGAYSVAIATCFNGFPLSTLKYQLNGQTLAALKCLPGWPVLKQMLINEQCGQRKSPESVEKSTT